MNEAAAANPKSESEIRFRSGPIYAGRDFRLTDVHGHVVKELLA